MLALGRIAHESAVRALKLPLSKFPFAHGARHPVTPAVSLFDSYHCSRYNTNTGVLTEAMFRQVFASVRAELDRTDAAAPAAGEDGARLTGRKRSDGGRNERTVFRPDRSIAGV